jgi:hypothetical protein
MTTAIEPMTTARSHQLQRRNSSAVEYLLNNTGLRRPVSVEPRADAVYVTVADPIALLSWLDELGGVPQVVDLPHGFRVWTLRATYPWIADETVPVRVCAVSPLQDDELPHELRAARS